MALCMTHLNSHYGPGVFTKEIQSASVHFSQIGLHQEKQSYGPVPWEIQSQ